MADLGQDNESLKLKVIEVEIRIRQKKAAIFNLETERLATGLNINKMQQKLDNFDANVEEIEKQIKSDEKDLDSINSNIIKKKE